MTHSDPSVSRPGVSHSVSDSAMRTHSSPTTSVFLPGVDTKRNRGYIELCFGQCRAGAQVSEQTCKREQREKKITAMHSFARPVMYLPVSLLLFAVSPEFFFCSNVFQQISQINRFFHVHLLSILQKLSNSTK